MFQKTGLNWPVEPVDQKPRTRIVQQRSVICSFLNQIELDGFFIKGLKMFDRTGKKSF